MKKFLGVELARTGKFDASTGPVTLTQDDFDNIAAAYLELKGKVDIPVKLGHDEQNILEEAGLPAAGWVENVRRVGDKLVADIIGVPDGVAKLIESGALRKRSIEAIRNVKLAGKKYKMALTGLALLGAELPAVDSLQDITALYASGAVVSAGILVLVDSEGAEVVRAASTETMPKPTTPEEVDELLEELREVINKIAATTAGKRGAPKLRQLLSVAVDELKRTRKIHAGAETNETGESEEMDIAKLRAMLKLPETATEEEVLAALAKLTADPPQDEPKPDDPPGEPDAVAAALAAFKSELADAQKQIVMLTTDKAKNEVTSAVDEAIKARRFMPASRDSLIKLALADKASFDELVKGTPANSVLAPERGTTSTSEVPSELEPTDIELKIAAQMGTSKDKLIAAKAKEAGINYVPVAAGKKE